MGTSAKDSSRSFLAFENPFLNTPYSRKWWMRNGREFTIASEGTGTQDAGQTKTENEPSRPFPADPSWCCSGGQFSPRPRGGSLHPTRLAYRPPACRGGTAGGGWPAFLP